MHSGRLNPDHSTNRVTQLYYALRGAGSLGLTTLGVSRRCGDCMYPGTLVSELRAELAARGEPWRIRHTTTVRDGKVLHYYSLERAAALQS